MGEVGYASLLFRERNGCGGILLIQGLQQIGDERPALIEEVVALTYGTFRAVNLLEGFVEFFTCCCRVTQRQGLEPRLQAPRIEVSDSPGIRGLLRYFQT